MAETEAAPGSDAQAAERIAQIRADLPERVRAVRERISAAARRAGRAPEAVELIAVTKTVPAEALHEALTLGLRHFGENRVQEARVKVETLALPDLHWELIGHLQGNKAARAVALFDRVQSVDSVALAHELDARAARLGHTLPILLEVNVAGEASKTGFAPEALVEGARLIAACAHLRLDGLMTVAPLAEQPEAVRPIFRRLRALRDLLRERLPQPSDVGEGATPGGWTHLSMGMTDDFEVAIEEGATLVRIGRALFGPRPQREG